MINFNSKITKKVLPYFFLNQEKELYLNEISAKFEVDRANLSRKLTEWVDLGVLNKRKKGNLSLYKINKKYPYLLEMKKMIQKSFGVEKKLSEDLKSIKGLKSAYIFGSYAIDVLGAESDIDLLLIGSHDVLEVQKRIIHLQKYFDREINVVDMTEKEFKQKEKSDLIKNIFKNKYIKIL